MGFSMIRQVSFSPWNDGRRMLTAKMFSIYAAGEAETIGRLF
jgi:hypothetical protein